MSYDVIANANKLPIVIIANYRTGSSELGKLLADHHKIPWLPNPLHHPTHKAELEQCYNSKSNYVTEFIVDHIPKLSLQHKVLASDCYKIRLTRDNALEQIVSHYIAILEHAHKETDPEYIVAIDNRIMERAADTIFNNNKLLKNLNVKFDIDCTYESLGFENIGKPVQPTNLDEIRKLAEQAIKNVK